MAKSSGLTKVSSYRYFETKTDLVQAAAFPFDTPFFCDSKFAVASSHNSTDNFTVSIIAFVANLAEAGYQVRAILKTKKNPLTDDLCSDLAAYQAIRNVTI